MTAEDVIREAVKLCRRHSAEKVILFGSRAKGTALERSDIDLAVSGVQDISELEEELEALPTLYKIDLVNLDTCRNRLLLEDIEVYGRKVYPEI